MSFREFAMKVLEPLAIWTMVAGIVFLCQPWIQVLHAYSVLVILIGLIGFNIAAHVPHPPKSAAEEAPRG